MLQRLVYFSRCLQAATRVLGTRLVLCLVYVDALFWYDVRVCRRVSESTASSISDEFFIMSEITVEGDGQLKTPKASGSQETCEDK